MSYRRIKKHKLVSIEAGSHFVTFTLDQRQGLPQLALEIYHWLPREFPELVDIQQPRLAHEPNDPKIYHPLNEPNPRHFHIRTKVQPGPELLARLQRMVSKFVHIGDEVEWIEWKAPEDYPSGLSSLSDEEYIKVLEEYRDS